MIVSLASNVFNRQQTHSGNLLFASFIVNTFCNLGFANYTINVSDLWKSFATWCYTISECSIDVRPRRPFLYISVRIFESSTFSRPQNKGHSVCISYTFFSVNYVLCKCEFIEKSNIHYCYEFPSNKTV